MHHFGEASVEEMAQASVRASDARSVALLVFQSGDVRASWMAIPLVPTKGHPKAHPMGEGREGQSDVLLESP
jgi:hypothetical protein